MKKTLIMGAVALGFAASAVAATETVDYATLLANEGTYTLTETIGEGKVNAVTTMVLDAAAFQTAIKGGSISDTLILSMNGGDNGAIKIGIGFHTVNGVTGLYTSWNTTETFTETMVTYSGSTVNPNSLTNTAPFAEDKSYESVALTLSTNGAGTYVHLTLVDALGNATTISGRDSNLYSSDFHNIDSITYNTDYVQYVSMIPTDKDMNYYKDAARCEVLNTAAIKAAAVANAVPEPTTATLSLLALAGLAARRRRK